MKSLMILECNVYRWQQQPYGYSPRKPGAMTSGFLFFSTFMYLSPKLTDQHLLWGQVFPFSCSQVNHPTLIYKPFLNPFQLAIITTSLFWNQSRADILYTLTADSYSHDWGLANNNPAGCVHWTWANQSSQAGFEIHSPRDNLYADSIAQQRNHLLQGVWYMPIVPAPWTWKQDNQELRLVLTMYRVESSLRPCL